MHGRGLIRRLYLSSVFGLIVGFVCWMGLVHLAELENWTAVSVGLERFLLGFAIGISRLRLAWWTHGVIMGVLFAPPVSILLLREGTTLFILSIALSAVYGVWIEFMTSVIFGARR